MQKKKNGYIWDKVTTDDGIEGYVARGEANEDYIILVTTNDVEIKGTGFKTSGINVICEPKITIENILAVDKDAVVLDGSEKEVKSGNLGTGYTIKANGSTYTVRKIGDANGDGVVTSADYVRIKNYLRGTVKLDENQKFAADPTGDGTVTSADYVRIKNYLRSKASITL